MTMNRIMSGAHAEAEVATDLLAGLLVEMAREAKPAAARPGKVPLKVYGVMAMTTALTFATLTTGYQLLFAPQLFA
jgi:hypothetical protein